MLDGVEEARAGATVEGAGDAVVAPAAAGTGGTMVAWAGGGGPASEGPVVSTAVTMPVAATVTERAATRSEARDRVTDRLRGRGPGGGKPGPAVVLTSDAAGVGACESTWGVSAREVAAFCAASRRRPVRTAWLPLRRMARLARISEQLRQAVVCWVRTFDASETPPCAVSSIAAVRWRQVRLGACAT
ncbi:hypothetical protein ADK52_09420 [Streptomyces sp. WM6372]|nr:hypothetical protein ADK52_09420 [Streptomyces sp. WM6372]